MLVRRRDGGGGLVFRSHPASCQPPGRSLTSSSTSSTFVLGGGSVTSIGSFSRWGGVGRLRVASSAQGVSLGSVLIIETVEVLGGGAVEVEPPVADEVVLVEESSVGAEEAVLGEAASSVGGADVESLALGLGVSVVTSVHLTLPM